MKTLDQRIKWIVANRPHVGSQTELARLAKLSEGILGAAKSKEKRDPTFRLSMESARKIAEVAGVDAEWVRTGEGVPDETYAGRAQYDTHEMRMWAATLAAEIEGVDEAKALWVISKIHLDHPSRERFLAEGIRRLRAVEQPTELTEEKIAGFTRQLARKSR